MPALDVTDLVSDTVSRGVTHRYGPAARRWLRDLPGIVEDLLTRYRLTLTGPLGGGALSAVLAVDTHDGQPAVLKIHPDPDTWATEHQTLTAWAAHATAAGQPPVAPRLLATHAPAAATLMTRLTPGLPLRKTPLLDLAAESSALAALFAVLRDTPAPDVAPLEPLGNRIRSSARTVLATAVDHPELATRLTGVEWLEDAATGTPALRPGTGAWGHGDLHPGNILDDTGRWMLLDPLPVAGEVASDVAFLAVTRLAGDRTRDLVNSYAKVADVDGDRVAVYARIWAADRLRVAVQHQFFGPAAWDALATVARHGPVT